MGGGGTLSLSATRLQPAEPTSQRQEPFPALSTPARAAWNEVSAAGDQALQPPAAASPQSHPV